MKVLLKEDVEHLGYAGEVRKVAPGYGRNYLLPRGMAVMANTAALKQAEAWRDRAAARRAQIKAEYDELSIKIEAVALTFEARAGESGRLYGSITPTQVADALAAQLGAEIDRRKIETGPIRELGEHSIAVRLDKDHVPHFSVTVNPEGAAEAEAEALAAAAAEAEAGASTLEVEDELFSSMEELATEALDLDLG